MLTVFEATLLKRLEQSPATTSVVSKELVIRTGEVAVGLMRLEQSKLILGYGLPKVYGILKEGEIALSGFRNEIRKRNLLE